MLGPLLATVLVAAALWYVLHRWHTERRTYRQDLVRLWHLVEEFLRGDNGARK